MPAVLAAALEALPEGVLLLGNTWQRGGFTILHANPALLAITGHPASELIGHPLQTLHPARGFLPPLRRWHLAAAPERCHSGEGLLRRHDGSTLYAAWNFKPVANARGRVSHLVATYRDLTAKQRFQEELIHAQRLDAVGRLAGGVAHDFNNLLSVINGYCEIMAGLPPVQRAASRQLNEIHQAAQKATSLVRQLLAFSRRQALVPQIVHLDQLVRNNADILSKLLQPDKDLALRLSAGAATVRIDPAQLQQVLLNLTLNARDALGPGGRVTLSTARRDLPRGRRADDPPAGPYLLLSISDNGAGMDAATQAHLFEPFFTTKEHGKGTGLGLALVYGVVQQSGGHIRVTSTPAKGTTFDIFLPEVSGSAQPAAPGPAPLPSTRGREAVLLLEPDQLVRKMLAGILTADGYRVISAPNPDAARALLARQRRAIDLVIADPASAQSALARELHQKHPRLRILCASSQPADRVSWLPPAAQTTVTKPYTLSALLHAARKLLDA